MDGICGTSPSTRPPRTSGIGYGTLSQLAIALRPAAETKRAASTIWRSLTRRILAAGGAGAASPGYPARDNHLARGGGHAAEGREEGHEAGAPVRAHQGEPARAGA